MCFCVKRDDFGVSFLGFVRGLFGVLGKSRVCFCAGFRGLNPYVEGLYVLHTVNTIA